jgi:hypothetical protein
MEEAGAAAGALEFSRENVRAPIAALGPLLRTTFVGTAAVRLASREAHALGWLSAEEGLDSTTAKMAEVLLGVAVLVEEGGLTMQSLLSVIGSQPAWAAHNVSSDAGASERRRAA